MNVYTKGDTYEIDDDMYRAGIHVVTDGRIWFNRIDAYGKTEKEAEVLRDALLFALLTAVTP